MKKITRNDALLLHELVLFVTGGKAGLRDDGILCSAIDNAFAGFGDAEFYPTVVEKAARIGYSVVKNHPFVDGNKRIGVLLALTLLEANGVTTNFTDHEVVHCGMALADGRMSFDDFAAYIRCRVDVADTTEYNVSPLSDSEDETGVGRQDECPGPFDGLWPEGVITDLHGKMNEGEANG